MDNWQRAKSAARKAFGGGEMSLFGSIMSLQDAINRLPQFEHQINRLTKEERNSLNRGSFRKNFVRQCLELHKQIDDHRKRTENARTDEVYKKENALEQIDRLKERLTELCPEKEQTTASTVSESEEEKAKVGAVDKPVVAAGSRRKSMMYDGDDSEEGSDNETEIIETDVHLEDPVAEPPQPRPRQPIAITRPAEAQTNYQKTLDEVSLLQNPVRDVSSETMEPVEVTGSMFMAIADFDPEVEGDLALRKGLTYRITQTRTDGWWTALDGNGQTGLVPKTFLQHMTEKPRAPLQSKVSTRLGVRDSVIGISTTTVPTRPGPASERMEERMTPRERGCLGVEFDYDPHLSLACHLAPRLSTSNIGFHDLFWSHDKDQVYKRTVHVSKIVRLLRFEQMPLIENKALVRVALMDVTNPKATQIVSNVHTMVPRVKGSTWYFQKKENETRSCIEFSDFVLRSNYSAPTVVLVFEATHIVQTRMNFEEKSLGRTYLRLIIDDKVVPSRTNVLFLDNEIMSKMNMQETSKKRVFLQVMDVPKDKAPFVDSLPDVIVSNLLYLPFFHFYRRRAGTILIRDNKNPLNAEYISDPLLSVFPHVCDQHDVMGEMLKLWAAKKKILSKKSEVEQAAEFFQTFIHTAFFIHGTGILPDYDVKDDSGLDIRKHVITRMMEALKRGTLRELLALDKCRPVNILDYSVDLLGPHSID